MPKAKKFIDKKNSVTFHLVHRSQKDPLISDDTAPQHVLVEAADKQNKGDKRVQQDEQRKWGVFYDDDYDYMQHLRDAKDVSVNWAPAVDPSRPVPVREKIQKPKKNVRINLPSSLFASEVEDAVGLLNKAAPQSGLRLDLDPDIVAAMDEDFKYDDPDNMLEDNFMELAMMEGGEEEYSGDEDDEYDDDDSQRGYASDNQLSDSDDSQRRGCPRKAVYDEDDNKSRFSQYSMSSSVMRRNNGLTLLDDRFEKMFAEYDDTEIGALDCDDIEGYLQATPEVLLKCAEQFHDQRRSYQLDEDKEVRRITRLQEIEEEDEVKDEDLFGKEEEVKEKWDCESILSTYSNIYNHPKLIEEPKRNKKIKISAKTGIPLGVLEGSDTNKLTLKSLARFNVEQAKSHKRNSDSDDDDSSVCESVMSTLSVLSLRPKDETPEEKKERKRLLREFRQERRIERKANTQAFKDEKKRQDKISMNNRNNIQGIKIV